MADENLEFGIGFNEVNKENITELWKRQEASIQSKLDKNSKLKLPIDDIAIKNLNKELDITKKKLSDIISLQGRTGTRPATPLQASKINTAEQKAVIDLSYRQAINIDKVAISHERLSQATLRTEKMQRALLNSTNSQNKAFRTQAGILNGLPQFINAYASLLGGVRFISNIKDITAEFERQKVSLAALTQNATFANQLFENIKQNAIASPFSAKDLISYTKQLAAYNVENKDLYGTMNMLADVSAGLGVDMSRLILAYGQVGASAVLKGTELRQFTEAGIPLVQLLADKFTELNGKLTTTGDVFELISKRAVPFEMIKEIFTDMTSEGGKFFEMQKIQAESLWGVYENLTDNIEQGFDKIGRSNRDILVSIGEGATVLVQNLDYVFSSLTFLGSGFAVLKLAIIANNSMIGENNAELIKNILSNKAKEATLLKQASIYRELNAEEKIKLATSGKITTANLIELATSGSLTKEMALRLVATRKMTTAQAVRLSTTLNITKAEVAQAAATTLAGRAYLVFGGAIRRVSLALKSLLTNPMTWIFVAISGIIKLTTVISEHSKKVKEDYENSKKSLREYSEQVAKSYNDVKSVIDKGLTFKVDTTEVLDAINTLKGLVGDNQGMYSLLMQGTGGENSMVQNLALMVANWENINEGIKKADNSLFVFSDAVNAVDSPWFSDSITTNIKDVEGNLNDVRGALVELDKEGIYDLGIADLFSSLEKGGKSVEEITSFAVDALRKLTAEANSGKVTGTEYLPLRRQLLDLISDARTAQDQFADLDKYLASQFKGVDWSKATVAQKAELLAMKDAFDKTNTNMTETGRKIWDAYFSKHYYLNFSVGNTSDGKELSAEQKDFNRFVDSIGKGELKIKDYTKDMSKQAKESYEAYEEANGKIGELQRKFTAGNKMVSQDSIDEQKKLANELLKVAKYLGYEEKNKGKGGTSKEDPRIAQLKKEIELVDKVYKEYERLKKLYGDITAENKLKELYGKQISSKFGVKLAFDTDSLKKEYEKASERLKTFKGDTNALQLDYRVKVSNADLDELENKLKDRLKDIGNNIERGQKASNFFEKMIGMTKDSDIATDITLSIYGDVGDVGKALLEQIQSTFAGGLDIEVGQITTSMESSEINDEDKKELQGRLDEIAQIKEEIKKAISGVYPDFIALRKLINKLPESYQKAGEEIVENGMQTNSLVAENLYKSLIDLEDYEHKKLKIYADAEQRRKDIELMPEKERPKLTVLSEGKTKKDLASLGYDDFKESDLYIKMFENLDGVSTSTLKSIKSKLTELKTSLGEHLDPVQLKELVSKFEAINDELIVRNPFKTLIQSIKEYNALGVSKKQAEKNVFAADKDVENKKESLSVAKEKLRLAQEDVAVTFSDNINKNASLDMAKSGVAFSEKQLSSAEKRLKTEQGIADAAETSMSKIKKSIMATSEWSSKAGASFGALNGVMADFGVNLDTSELAATFADLDNVLSGVGSITKGILDLDPAAVIQGIGSLAQGFIGIFTGLNRRVARANKEIKKQERILKDLDRAYKNLERTQKVVLGSDLSENNKEQLDNLKAQEAAYRKQMEAENTKGKKKSQDKVNEYYDNMIKAQQEFADKKKELLMEMGVANDVELAKSWAKSWLDAYIAIGRQGAITTDEIKSQWRDMMKDMVANSILAQIIQREMKPVFDNIDKLYADGKIPTDTELNAIFDQGNTIIDRLGIILPEAIKNLNISGLGDKADNLTGIAKNVAQASEDDITGLASGINTQNSYFAKTVTNTDNILFLMQKWDLERGISKTSNTDMTLQKMYDLQLPYLKELPQISTNTKNTSDGISLINDKLDSLIKPNGVRGSKAINVNI